MTYLFSILRESCIRILVFTLTIEHPQLASILGVHYSISILMKLNFPQKKFLDDIYRIRPIFPDSNVLMHYTQKGKIISSLPEAQGSCLWILICR